MKILNQIDMTRGPILKKLLMCCVPIILVNILQNLFHSADVLVLGMFTDDNCVAAVGTNTSLIALTVALFNGLAVGANVVVAKRIGSEDGEGVRRSVGLSVVLGLTSGTLLLTVGVIFAAPFHRLLSCKPEYFDMAVDYFRVYCLGMPIIMLYNYTSAVMRASGDTFRPLLFLMIGGVLNVGGNVIFIKVFEMGVVGVAVSTIISQGVSALMCVFVLMRNKGICRLELKYIRPYKRELKEMLGIGIPTGLQSLAFSLPNLVITSTVNQLDAMAGNALAQQFDGLIYNTGYGISLGTVSFVGQNLGAGEFERIKKTIFCALGLILTAGLAIGTIIYSFSDVLCGIASSSQKVIADAKLRLLILCFTYWLCGWQDVCSSSLRVLGKSVTAFLITFLTVSVFRIVWIYSLINVWQSMVMVYLCWPISWVLNFVIQSIMLKQHLKKSEACRVERACPSIGNG